MALAKTAPINLAIVAQVPEARKAADLLTVEFSRNDRVHLLERTEIDKIYREQKLSVASKDYLALGRILGADGLLLIESAVAARPGSSRALSNELIARLIAIKPGVVLNAQQFSVTNIPEWAPSFVLQFNQFAPKLAVLAKDAVPLTIVNLRSATGSREAADTETKLKSLAILRLSQESRVFVLERQRMQLLSQEKELKSDESPFWNGSYLLDGIIDQNRYSKDILTISGSLSPPHGGKPLPFEVEGSRTNLAEVINRLAAKVAELLQIQTTMPEWNPAEEAAQFYTNAAWALRWSAVGEAQTASEAAWALAAQTEPVARLRTRAYIQGISSPRYSGNLEIPGLPDPEKFRPLLRALELFCQDAPRFSTNSSGASSPKLDDEWLQDGIWLFQEAAAILDGFHRWAELTAEHKDEIADVRSSGRQLLSLLDSNLPSDRAPLAIPSQHRFRLLERLEKYDLVKWYEGSLFFERPEDSLPMLHTVAAGGFLPEHPPRFVAWNREERKKVPNVARQFTEELCGSTNPPVRLVGAMVAVLQTPFYPETVFHQKEAALCATIWELRDWIFNKWVYAGVPEKAEEILRSAYGESGGTSDYYFSHEPFASTRFHIQMDYLRTSTNINLFSYIFPRNSATAFPPEQALEIAQLMEPRATNALNTGIRNYFRARAGLALTTNSPSSAPSLPAEDPLNASFVTWNPIPGAGHNFHYDSLKLRNGSLWTLAEFGNERSEDIFDSPNRSCISVEPATGRCQEFPFPSGLGRLDHSFEITEDAIYLSAQNYLARYRFATREWDTVPWPIEGAAQLLALGHRLYAANADTLLELDTKTLAVRVVASGRRFPAINPLDSILGSGVDLYARSDANLGILASNRFFTYQPGAGTLMPGAIGPQWMLGNRNQTLVYSPTAVLLRSDSPGECLLTAFWHDKSPPELLLRHLYSMQGFPMRSRVSESTPRWDWPAIFDLDETRIAADGTNLWLLVPRKTWIHPGKIDEPVKFSDARQATLFRFEPGSRLPLSIPAAFEKTDIDPFDPMQSGYFRMHFFKSRGAFPLWIYTPAGLVLSVPAVKGHWLLPKASLDSRLSRLGIKTQSEAKSR